MVATRKVLSCVKSPISPAYKVEDSSVHTKAYAAVKDEIDKLNKITEIHSIKWDVIIDQSLYVLSKQAKDVKIVCFLAYALIRENTSEGVVQGLESLYEFIKKYWKTAHPKGRMAVKVNSLQWFFESSAKYIVHAETLFLDKKTLTKAKELTDALIKQCQKYAINEMIVYPLTNALDKLSMQLSESHSEASDNSTDKASPFDVTKDTETIEIQQHVFADGENIQALDEAAMNYCQHARAMMKANPCDVYAYYLNRVSTFSLFAQCPIDNDGLTTVPPPSKYNQGRINTLMSLGNNVDLLLLLEELIPQEPFWLDLHVMVINTAKKLGDKYSPIVELVHKEVTYFLERLPGIENLLFADRTPFLKDKSLGFSSVLTEKNACSIERIVRLTEIQKEQLNAIKKEAFKHRKKSTAKDICQLDLLKKEAVSNRVKLLAYMAICKELMAIGNNILVKPYLSFIVELIEFHNLVQWDSGIALEALTLVYRGMQQLNTPPALHEMEKVLSMITRIDITTANELSQLK